MIVYNSTYNQQNEQSSLALIHRTLKKKVGTSTYDVGNQGPGLEQVQKCCEVKPVTSDPTLLAIWVSNDTTYTNVYRHK